MQLDQRCFKIRKHIVRRFKNSKYLAAIFDLSLPSIDRLDRWNEIHARCELPFHQSRANLTRLLCLREGAKDYQNVTHVATRTPKTPLRQA